jgi:DNA-binding Lrp family transcriptional regulator
VVRALSRRHEITKLYSVSGRYDLCAMLLTESTQELDAVLDKIRVIKGVVDTFSTIMLSTKLDRPE